MKSKAIIISIKSTKLSRLERILLSKEKPWGIILFKRNLRSFNQIRKLTNQVKILTKNRKFPIIIDEEGGSVSRLKDIINNNISANFFGSIFKKDKSFCLHIYKHYIFSICKVLNQLGININTVPVLDILRNTSSKIIGTRSFSTQKEIVKKLGSETIKHLHSNKILGIIKHVPGHGAAKTDSHKNLPKVALSIKKLNMIDFYPFKFTKAKLAMTAHILYSKIDGKNPATHSKKIIKNVIRKNLKFRGIIISDDISMKALKHDLRTNARKSLQAGCNLVLYCSGKTSDNFKLIKSVPFIDGFTSKKTSEIKKVLG